MLLLIILISCNSKSNTSLITLSDLSRDTSISIKTSKKYPTTVKISVTGFANDSFVVNSANVKGGNIDTSWHYDWYNNIIIINYKSFKATKGSLRISCTAL